MIRINVISFFAIVITTVVSCEKFDVDKSIEYCATQASETLESLSDVSNIPNAILCNTSNWIYTQSGSWTCGFWPGQLWYLYESTEDEKWLDAAIEATELIIPVSYTTPHSHDVGFMTMPSIGIAYNITKESRYKEALISAADSLATLYNPNVGSILSWPNMVSRMNWPHNTIIDNMLNLELLFWVAQNENRQDLYDIALSHAEVTMKYHFREDNSTFHVTVFDDKTGEFISGYTHQGWKDQSTWSRGQAWAIYGFTMTYRFTRDKRFLQVAINAADYFLNNLPSDGIPYWDFDAGRELDNQPKDASAAAIVASALLELQSYVPEKKDSYIAEAEKLIQILSSPSYRSGNKCSSFILHCTGHFPNNSEIDASISYGDYYYLESLIRLKKLKGNHLTF